MGILSDRSSTKAMSSCASTTRRGCVRNAPAVIAGPDPAIPIIWHRRAVLSGMAGSSLVKRGHDDSTSAERPLVEPQARHHQAVDELAGTERVGAAGAFDLEAEFLVEADAGLVVDIDGELDPADVEPVVGGIDEGGEQRGADAAAAMVVVHRHEELRGMAAPAFVLHETREPDDAAIEHGDDAGDALAGFLHHPPPIDAC